MRLGVLFSVVAAVILPAAANGQPLRSDPPPVRIHVEPETVPFSLGSADRHDLSATWSGTPQWLEGIDLGGSAFNGGVFYGRDWWHNSTVGAEADVPVRVVFDRFETTYARVFRRDLGYADRGVGLFRGAAYDISNPDRPQRLNVAFVEDPRLCNSADGVWGPGPTADGCREFLYVLASEYDGDGGTYAGQTSFNLDLLYAIATRVPAGRSLYESSPASLTMSFPPLRFFQASVVENGRAELSVSYSPTVPFPSGSTVSFLASGDGTAPQRLSPSHPAGGESAHIRAIADGLDGSLTYQMHAQITDASGTPLHDSQVVHLRPVVSHNTALVGTWSERSGWADVWGYVSPNGTEYALIALQGLGMSIVDISGAAPTEVGFVPTVEGAADSKDVKVVGHHAYLVNETGPIQIIDLSDPTAPLQVGLLDTQPGVTGGGAHNVSVDDRYLYVTGGRQVGNAGLRIYSVEDPAAPALVGEFRPTHFPIPYYHDFYVDGDRGYGPNIYGGGVDIMDLTDRSAPRLLGTFRYPGSGAHNVCGTVDDRYVFVGDEIGSAGNWTRVFDVHDPSDVEYVTDIVVNPEAVVHNCYLHGSLLHVGHYTEGYRVFDVQDPHHPEEVAVYDTYLPPEVGYNGVWSIYPYFPSGRVAISDRSGGLFVVELDDATSSPSPSPETRPFSLGPNPTADRFTVRVELAEETNVRITLHDARGRLLLTVQEGEATGVLRRSVPTANLGSGIYLLRIQTGEEVQTRTVTVIR